MIGGNCHLNKEEVSVSITQDAVNTWEICHRGHPIKRTIDSCTLEAGQCAWEETSGRRQYSLGRTLKYLEGWMVTAQVCVHLVFIEPAGRGSCERVGTQRIKELQGI